MMKKQFKNLLVLLVVICFFGCDQKSENNKATRILCNVNKMDVLLNDIMNKRFFYASLKPVGENSLPYKNLLFLRNIPTSDSIFYWKISKALNPDSLKLTLVKDSLIDLRHTNSFGIVLKESNRDTTEVELDVDSGQNKIALVWTTYRYKFDYDKCKWVVKDSVFNQY